MYPQKSPMYTQKCSVYLKKEPQISAEDFPACELCETGSLWMLYEAPSDIYPKKNNIKMMFQMQRYMKVICQMSESDICHMHSYISKKETVSHAKQNSPIIHKSAVYIPKKSPRYPTMLNGRPRMYIQEKHLQK